MRWLVVMVWFVWEVVSTEEIRSCGPLLVVGRHGRVSAGQEHEEQPWRRGGGRKSSSSKVIFNFLRSCYMAS
ncbi:hypothetical protein QBC37DRAFT_418057 [Rhypophila decipiens]|uniref:Secreted protein n=1 Tax=Rhypophila decipiens TaxID=261697 RepID=A0AAN6YC68_9PEZI|nr:hypothetical protein QBC37DRAFT_418057 [Rhypophila decipiens]